MLGGNKKVSILILNYNGRALLEECLPSVVKAALHNNSKYEVVVIDNNSTDDSIQFLKDKFPAVKVAELKENRYLFSYNNVVKNCQGDYVILLNNDMRVEKDFIEPLLEKMKDEKVFSVMPNIKDWDGSKYKEGGNKNRVYFRKGWIDWKRVEDEKEGITFFTCAGAAIYNRKKFIEIGGFDELFYPIYVEDVDLSYRAWKRGWTNYYEPKSVVFHKDSYTMKKQLVDKRRWELKIRNKYLFFWKNIHDRRLFREHIEYIPLVVAKSLVKRESVFTQGLCQALKIVKKARERSAQERKQSNKLSDKDIIQMFNK